MAGPPHVRLAAVGHVRSMPLSVRSAVMAVCPFRRWVFVPSNGPCVIEVVRLVDGSHVKTLGCGRGHGPGKLHVNVCGISVTGRGSLFVTDEFNSRVVEVNPD